jgi:hypothetical protein
MYQRKPAKKNSAGASTSHDGDVVHNEAGEAGNTETDANIETEVAGNNVQSSKPAKNKVIFGSYCRFLFLLCCTFLTI